MVIAAACAGAVLLAVGPVAIGGAAADDPQPTTAAEDPAPLLAPEVSMA